MIWIQVACCNLVPWWPWLELVGICAETLEICPETQNYSRNVSQVKVGSKVRESSPTYFSADKWEYVFWTNLIVFRSNFSPLTKCTYHIVVPRSHMFTGMGVSGEILGVSGVKNWGSYTFKYANGDFLQFVYMFPEWASCAAFSTAVFLEFFFGFHFITLLIMNIFNDSLYTCRWLINLKKTSRDF